MNWILHREKQPENGQSVIYYYEMVGVHRGKYDAEGDCFYGKKGFLCGDVTHWLPDDGQDELPERPV